MEARDRHGAGDHEQDGHGPGAGPSADDEPEEEDRLDVQVRKLLKGTGAGRRGHGLGRGGRGGADVEVAGVEVAGVEVAGVDVTGVDGAGVFKALELCFSTKVYWTRRRRLLAALVVSEVVVAEGEAEMVMTSFTTFRHEILRV